MNTFKTKFCAIGDALDDWCIRYRVFWILVIFDVVAGTILLYLKHKSQ